MKENKEFKNFDELKEKYYKNPTKAQKEEVTNEVINLIINGWVTQSMKIVYDFGIEKYRTIGLQSMKYKVYDKDKTIRVMLKQTYKEFLPKNPLDYIQGKELIFNPHEPLNFERDNIQYANLFIKSKFLSFNSKGKRINYIEWDKYKAITPLFENVFKTKERMNFFVNWLAYGFQTLSKARTAIISKGIQGTGKGVIFEQIIQYAVGENYTTILENEALKSRFNGELENKLFVLANEIKADFKEGNSTYERLKMYVTDKEIRFEDKNIKARTIPNFFNIWFHSNNDVPLQIQGSDRRYTVFNTKSKKLTEVSEELGYEHISYFIEHIKAERDSFIYDIMSLNYDMQKATTPLNTEEKELIYEASMSKIEILSDKLKKSDIEYLKEGIEDFYNSNDVYEGIGEIKNAFVTDIDFIKELSLQMRGNFIKNEMAKYLYKIFVNENEKERKIGLQFNKYFGKAILKKVNGKVFKYRKLDSDKKIIFEFNEEPKQKTIPIEIENPNGEITIKNHAINPNETIVPSDW
jgi:hypothetical protein